MANVDFDAAQLQWGLVESQVQQRWRCSRDPIYTTKHKQDFSILTHCKNNKDFNSTSEHRFDLDRGSRLQRSSKM